MSILRKLGATVTAVAIVGVGALTVGTTAANAAAPAPQVAPKAAVAKAAAKKPPPRRSTSVATTWTRGA